MAISTIRHMAKTVSENCTPETKACLTPREIFIQAGIELMNKGGPDSLSLNGILTQANKPRGSFYAIFEDKDAYLSVLVRRYFQPATDILQLFAESVLTEGRDTIEAWASWNAHRVLLAINRGDRVVSLTEMAGRCSQPSLTAEACEAIFHQRTVALSAILSAVFLLTEPEARMRASLMLAMLDGVESRASATRSPDLVDQFYLYFFKHIN